jgi:hypothetical protein
MWHSSSRCRYWPILAPAPKITINTIASSSDLPTANLTFQVPLNLPIMSFVLTPRGFLPSFVSLSFLVLSKARLTITAPIR